MATPRTPASEGGGSRSSSTKPSISGVNKTSSVQDVSPGPSCLGGSIGGTGASLPVTPMRLSDIDPAIVLSVKSRNRSLDRSAEKHFDHFRNGSNTAITAAPKDENDPFIGTPPTNSAQVTSAVEADLKNIKSPTPKPREDRDGSKISSENAQGFFKASYCVFVANLAVNCRDDELEGEVQKVFSRFGELWTKIRRDRNGMPYAFCQYTIEADAGKALEGGHGLMICGRPCRVERARANRKDEQPYLIPLTNQIGSVYLSRTAGGAISENQAREILNKTGPIEKFWYPTDTDKEVYRLPEGIWATFTFFQDARDAQSNFKDSKEYRLEIPYSPEEHERQRTNRFKFSPLQSTPVGRLRPGFRWPSSGNRFTGHTTSIFIGNLPASASVESLRETFDTCGTVRTIEIIGKPHHQLRSMNTFAFVEFVSEIGAKNALNREINFNGRRIRIEPRESPDQPSKFGGYASGSPHTRGPVTPRTPSNNHNTDVTVKTGGTVANTPAQMIPIYEGGQQGNEHPQTPAQQIIAHPFMFGSPFGSYGGFYSTTQADAGQTTVPAYTSAGASPGPYAYPGYYHGYPLPYVYNTPTHGDAVAPFNGDTTNTSVNTTPEQENTVNDELTS